MALLQIHTTPLGQGLPSPPTLMFNRPVHGIMPVVDHKPIGQDCDDEHYHKLVDRQQKITMVLHQFLHFITIWSTVATH